MQVSLKAVRCRKLANPGRAERGMEDGMRRKPNKSKGERSEPHTQIQRGRRQREE